jgi:hypothetical protein
MHTHSLHSRATRRRGESKALHPLPEGEGGVRGQSPCGHSRQATKDEGLAFYTACAQRLRVPGASAGYLSPKVDEPVASDYECKRECRLFLKCTEDDRACRIRMFAGCILWVTFLRAIKKGDKRKNDVKIGCLYGQVFSV